MCIMVWERVRKGYFCIASYLENFRTRVSNRTFAVIGSQPHRAVTSCRTRALLSYSLLIKSFPSFIFPPRPPSSSLSLSLLLIGLPTYPRSVASSVRIASSALFIPALSSASPLLMFTLTNPFPLPSSHVPQFHAPHSTPHSRCSLTLVSCNQLPTSSLMLTPA